MTYDDKEVTMVNIYVRIFGPFMEGTALTGDRLELWHIAIGEREKGAQRRSVMGCTQLEYRNATGV